MYVVNKELTIQIQQEKLFGHDILMMYFQLRDNLNRKLVNFIYFSSCTTFFDILFDRRNKKQKSKTITACIYEARFRF